MLELDSGHEASSFIQTSYCATSLSIFVLNCSTLWNSSNTRVELTVVCMVCWSPLSHYIILSTFATEHLFVLICCSFNGRVGKCVWTQTTAPPLSGAWECITMRRALSGTYVSPRRWIWGTRQKRVVGGNSSNILLSGRASRCLWSVSSVKVKTAR